MAPKDVASILRVELINGRSHLFAQFCFILQDDDWDSQ